jgi:hypothetical protein
MDLNPINNYNPIITPNRNHASTLVRKIETYCHNYYEDKLLPNDPSPIKYATTSVRIVMVLERLN